MTLKIPPEIPSWVVAAVAGPWPKGDEDALRRLGHAWIALGEAITRISHTTGEARQRALTALEGKTANALKENGIDLDSDLGEAAKACHSLGEQCLHDALYTEFGKYVIIGSLAALAIQLAVDLLVPGIGQVQATAATTATRLTVRAAFRDLIANLGADGARAAAGRLVKVVLFKGATMGAIQGGLIPLGADVAQMLQHNRKAGDFDWEQIGLGVVAGAAAGAAGEYFGGRAMMGLERRISTDRFAGRTTVRLVGAAAGGGAGAVAAVASIVPFTGRLELGWDHILPGIVGGALGSMPHALRGPAGPGAPAAGRREPANNSKSAPEQSGVQARTPSNGRREELPAVAKRPESRAPHAERPAAKAAPRREAAAQPKSKAERSTPSQKSTPASKAPAAKLEAGPKFSVTPRQESLPQAKAEAPQAKSANPQQQAGDRPVSQQRSDADRQATPGRVEPAASPDAESAKPQSPVSAPRVDPTEVPPTGVREGRAEFAAAMGRLLEQHNALPEAINAAVNNGRAEVAGAIDRLIHHQAGAPEQPGVRAPHEPSTNPAPETPVRETPAVRENPNAAADSNPPARVREEPAPARETPPRQPNGTRDTPPEPGRAPTTPPARPESVRQPEPSPRQPAPNGAREPAPARPAQPREARTPEQPNRPRVSAENAPRRPIPREAEPPPANPREAPARQPRAAEESTTPRSEPERPANRRRTEEEAANRRRTEEEAANRRRTEEEAANRRRTEEEAANRRRTEEEAANRRRTEEEAANRRRTEEEAANRRRTEEEATARRPSENDEFIDRANRENRSLNREFLDSRFALKESDRVAFAEHHRAAQEALARGDVDGYQQHIAKAREVLQSARDAYRETDLRAEPGFSERKLVSKLRFREQREFTKDEYIQKWEKKLGRKITPEELLTLERGCIGVVMARLGRDDFLPPLDMAFGDPAAHPKVAEAQGALAPGEAANARVNAAEEQLRKHQAQLAAARRKPGATEKSPEVVAARKQVEATTKLKERYDREARAEWKKMSAALREQKEQELLEGKIEAGERTFERVSNYADKLNRILESKPQTAADFLAQVRADPELAQLKGIEALLPKKGDPSEWEAVIFSKHFWSGNDGEIPAPERFVPDPITGQVDMAGKPTDARNGMINFDYGFYDKASGSWLHANHLEPKTPEQRARFDAMKVFQSSPTKFFSGYTDFDSSVICIAFVRRK